MVGSGGIPFNVQQFVQVLHEVRVELGTPVMDDLLRDAMELEDVIAIQLGHALRCDGGVGGHDDSLKDPSSSSQESRQNGFSFALRRLFRIVVFASSLRTSRGDCSRGSRVSARM